MNAIVKPYHHGNLAEAILQRAAEIIDAEGVEAMTLRGIARDLGVSHAAPNRHFKNKAALLAALAAEAWLQARDATLNEAEQTGSDNAHVRLAAMGRGYLRWALNHRSLFRASYHPDVNRYASKELVEAIHQFNEVVRQAVSETQLEGRHADVPLSALTVFTNAVPTGAALLMIDPLLGKEFESDEDQEIFIKQVIDLVVPPPK